MSKVAVASSDGVIIDEHFGRAKEFYIFEVFESGEYLLLERRQTIESVDNTAEHGHAKLSVELLQDVEAVLIAQIGPNASKMLESKGIRVFTVNITIEKALQTYGKKSRFIKNLSLNCSGCDTGSGSRQADWKTPPEKQVY